MSTMTRPLLLLLLLLLLACHTAGAETAEGAAFRPRDASSLGGHQPPRAGAAGEIDRAKEETVTVAAALALASAALRALAQQPQPSGWAEGTAAEAVWRSAALELASGLLVGDRLPALLGEPTLASAVARELKGLRCAPSMPPGAGDDEAPARREMAQTSPRPRPVESGADQERAAGRLRQKARLRIPTAPLTAAVPGGLRSSAGSLEPGPDTPTLWDAFIHDPASPTWQEMGWNRTTDPCGNATGTSGEGIWIGPACMDKNHPTRVSILVLQYPDTVAIPGRVTPDLSKLAFELGPAIGNLTYLQTFGLTDLAMLSGTLPKELGQLQHLNQFVFYNNPRLSGTMPWELGNMARIEMLSLYQNPRMSGTLPAWGNLTAHCQQRHCNTMGHLESLYLTENPRLSGTFPKSFGNLGHNGTNNPKGRHTLTELYAGANSGLNGTIPTEFGNLMALVELDLQDNSGVTGSIPASLSQLKKLELLYLSNGGYSGEIPTSLGSMTALTNLYLDRNPGLTGSLPSSLNKLTRLRRFDCFDNTGLSGKVPALGGCAALTQLDMHNCSFTRLPKSLPDSLTHLYLGQNPFDATTTELSKVLTSLPNSTLHVLDVGFVNSKIQLEPNAQTRSAMSTKFGTRVTNPSPCFVGAGGGGGGRKDPCAFLLSMYDDYDRPLTTGGMITNLSVGLNGTQKQTLMHDNRDGTFTATIPDDWVATPGDYLFQFYHDETEFKPAMDGPHHLAVAPDCMNVPSGRYQKWGGNCTGVRTVEFELGSCNAHSQPDQTNTHCVCMDGYQPNIRAHGGQNRSSPLSCHRSCDTGESVGNDGASCVCSGHYYDTAVHGVLICSKGGWPVTISQAVKDALERRKGGHKCATECPDECTSCENGIPTIKEGWRLNFTSVAEFSALVAHAKGSHAQVVFSCPSAGDCPEITLPGASESGPPEDEESSTVGSTCPNDHTGLLCAECSGGYSHQGLTENTCSQCRQTAEYIENTFNMPVGWFAVMVIAVVGVGAYVAFRLQSHLKWLKTNARILIGSLQVLSLLPAVLQLVFPGGSGKLFSFFALAVVDIRDIVRFECWGWGWQQRWVAEVLVLPPVTTLPVAAYYLWCHIRDRHLTGHGKKRADDKTRKQSIGALFFVGMLLYPQLSSAIFSALRCRTLGPDLSILEADYSVPCPADSFNFYSVLAYVMVVLVPLGLPAGLFGLLWNQRRRAAFQYNLATTSGRLPRGTNMQAIFEAAGSQRQFQQETAGDAFGFCVEDYREDCYWFEPVDMMRKLALSGLLQFVHRGTAAQCFCGSALAFASFGLQQYLRPYREHESNVLKALVDTQLFLTFLISFILRVLPKIDTAEPLDKDAYGWMLVGSAVFLFVAFVGLTAAQVRRMKTFTQSTIVQLIVSLSDRISRRTRGTMAATLAVEAAEDDSELFDVAEGSSRPSSQNGDDAEESEESDRSFMARANESLAASMAGGANRSRAVSLDESAGFEPEPEPGILGGSE